MSDKELHKLKRQEVLQILLLQVEEAEEMQRQHSKTQERLQEMTAGYDRLKARLDDKDAQIQKLEERLDDKDVKIKELKEKLEKQRTLHQVEMEEAGSLTEVTQRLSKIFENAQSAADGYLYNLKKINKGRRSLGRK